MISLQHQNSHLGLYNMFHTMEDGRWFGVSGRQLFQQLNSANITWTSKGDGFRFEMKNITTPLPDDGKAKKWAMKQRHDAKTKPKK